MSKKNHSNPPPRLVKVADKVGDELISEQPSERARLRAATVSQEQRDARTRREALALLEREDARRDAIAFSAPDEDLHSRRRPLGAPMATRIGAFPDPLAVLAWDAVVADAAATARRWWEKWQFTAALAVWSAACFVLGMLV